MVSGVSSRFGKGGGGEIEANIHDRSFGLISWIKGIRTMLPTVALRLLGEL